VQLAPDQPPLANAPTPRREPTDPYERHLALSRQRRGRRGAGQWAVCDF
jgi:hypothetical protein